MTSLEAMEYALPRRRLTNDELRATYPEWNFDRLEERTGVFERSVAEEDETALDFVLRACRRLESDGRLRVGEIDAVIFCTESPDHIMPPNACVLHGKLDMPHSVLAFDITLACSGYIYGLQLADSLIRSGAARRVLLATADTYTRYIHPRDRSTRCLFGDGGAVTILSDRPGGHVLRDVRCGSAGKHYQKFFIPAGGMRMRPSGETKREFADQSGNVRTLEHIQMDGLGVLSFFNTVVPCAVAETLDRNGLTPADIDVFVFHQASRVALDNLRKAMEIPAEKMIYDLAELGNLVSASIPVALIRALENGRVKRGQRALLCGFGAGLSWGTALVEL